ncbi:MAG: ankyrin repeat domain-containing protein [Rhizobiales bacterium]|nr:ankyrin repeat domain-containing protein [Hyphomicrobiales bacterium]
MNKLSKILGSAILVASLMSNTAFAFEGAKTEITKKSFYQTNTKLIDIELKKGMIAGELDEALYLAIRYGRDPEIIDYLLKKGANVNGKNAHHLKHIFNAAYYGTFEQLKAFLKHEPDITVLDDSKRTAFLRAFYGQQDLRAIRLMIKHGFKIDAKDLSGTNAIYTASYRNSLEVVKFLVEQGLDPKSMSQLSGENTIFRATNGPNAVEIIKYLQGLGVDHKLVSYKDQNIVTYMSERSRRSKHIDLFKTFVAEGISQHDKDENGRDALLIAAYRNDDLSFIKYLVETGSDINAVDKSDRNALNIASYRNKEKVVKYFIEAGLDVNTSDVDGKTSLLWSATRNNGSVKVIEALLAAGADATARDKDGNNAIMLVVSRDVSSKTEKGSVKEILKILVAAGDDLNMVNVKGETALIKAAQFGHHLDTLQYLVENGQDVNAANSYKLTPLMYAAMKASNVEVLEYLLSKGAKTDPVDDFGDAAIDLVKENELLKNTNAVELIEKAAKM